MTQGDGRQTHKLQPLYSTSHLFDTELSDVRLPCLSICRCLYDVAVANVMSLSRCSKVLSAVLRLAARVGGHEATRLSAPHLAFTPPRCACRYGGLGTGDGVQNDHANQQQAFSTWLCAVVELGTLPPQLAPRL